MKMLIMSDVESDVLKKYYKENNMDNVDFILSAGDLSNQYLMTVKEKLQKPLYYVRGNHDTYKPVFFDRECVEWKCIDVSGIKIVGIGCMKQNGQILSEKEMTIKLMRLCKKIKIMNGVDILVSHYPAFGIGEGKDMSHRGYCAIKEFIDETQPSYFVYGHNHLTYGRNERIFNFKNTVFLNAYEKMIVSIK